VASPQSPPLSNQIPPISIQEKANYAQLFKRSAPNGILQGDAARDIFLKLGLPNETLIQIWNLVDTQRRGKLDLKEFVLALHLIRSITKGTLQQLPSSIPPNILESFNELARSSSVSSNSSARYSQQVVSPVAQVAASSAIWEIPPLDKVKFDSYFDNLDKSKVGVIGASEVVPFLMTSSLSEEVLAQVWDLADTHHSGKFTKVEFAIAMFLVQQKLQGRELPATLPASLLSSASAPAKQQEQQHQRAGSISNKPAPPSSMNDLLSLGNALASPSQTTPTNNLSDAPAPGVRPFVPTSHFGQIISKENAEALPNPPTTKSAPPSVTTRVASPPAQRLSTPPVATSAPALTPVNAATSLPPVPAHSFGTALSSTAAAPVAAPAAPISRAISAAPAAALGAAAGLAGATMAGAVSSFGSNKQQSVSTPRAIDNQIKEVNGQVASISNDNSQLNGQVDVISAQLAQSNEKLQYAQSELKRVSALKETLQAKLVSIQAEAETDSKKLSELQEMLQQTEGEFDSLSATYTELQTSHESLKGQIVDAATKLEQEKQRNAELDEQIEDIQAEIETLEEQLDSLDKDSRQQTGLLAINKKKYSGLETQKEELTAKIAELQTELETTKTQLVGAEETHATVKNEADELTSKVEAATAEIDQFKGQITAANQEVESLKGEMEAAQTKFTSLEHEKALLQEELTKLHGNQEVSVKELAGLKEKTELLTTEIARLKEEREVTKKKLIAEETAKAEETTKLEKLEAEKALVNASTLSKEQIASINPAVGSEPATVSKSIDSDAITETPALSKIALSKTDSVGEATIEKPISKSIDADFDKPVAEPADVKTEQPISKSITVNTKNSASKSSDLASGKAVGFAAAAVAATAAIGSTLLTKPDAKEETDEVESTTTIPAVEKSISPAAEVPDQGVIKSDAPVDTKSVEPLVDQGSSCFVAEGESSGAVDSYEPSVPDASIRSLVAEPIGTSSRGDSAIDITIDATKDGENDVDISSDSSIYGNKNYKADEPKSSEVELDATAKPADDLSTSFVSAHSADSYDIVDKNEAPPASKLSESVIIGESKPAVKKSESFTIPGSLPEPVNAAESKFASTAKGVSKTVSEDEDAESQYSDAIEPADEDVTTQEEPNSKAPAVEEGKPTAGALAASHLAVFSTDSDSVPAQLSPNGVTEMSVVESTPVTETSEVATLPSDVKGNSVTSIPGKVITLAPTTQPVSLDFGEFTPVPSHSVSTVSLQGSKVNVADLDSFNHESVPVTDSANQEEVTAHSHDTVPPSDIGIISARDEFDEAFKSLNNDSANVWPTAPKNANDFDAFDTAFADESTFSRAENEDDYERALGVATSLPGQKASFDQSTTATDYQSGSELSYTNTPVFAQAPAGQFPVSKPETELSQFSYLDANSPFAPAQSAEIASSHPFFSQRNFDDKSLPDFLRKKKDIDPFDAAFDGLMAADEEKDEEFGGAGSVHPFGGSASAFAPAASTLDTFPANSNDQHAGVLAPAVSNSEWDSIFAGFGDAKATTEPVNTDDAFTPAVPSVDKPFGGVLKNLEEDYNHLDKNTLQQLEYLTSMGFDKARALEALEKNNFNIENASNFLLDQ
jgi:epidermal growth factor receptor substrate 15